MHAIDEIYQIIGQNIFNTLSEVKWDKAIADIEIQKNYVSFQGVYEYHGKQKGFLDLDDDQGFDVDLVSEVVEELNQAMSENPINKWNKAKVTLSSEGDFDMEFFWDQEYQDRVDSHSK
ncbi:MAG: hypothetical protein LBM27_00410 [Lactobacillaceae bacterium]|jgi:hypothetical protein|nr:hypothetical protein [Lactobacillaceae bacterium]